jgi:hypothetical protein
MNNGAGLELKINVPWRTNLQVTSKCDGHITGTHFYAVKFKKERGESLDSVPLN